MQGKGTVWFGGRSYFTGKVSGHIVDNTLTIEGQLQRDADATRTQPRKRLVRWENWFGLKSRVVRAAAPALPPASSASSSALEPFGLHLSVAPPLGGSPSLSALDKDSSPAASSPSSLRSSMSSPSLSTRGSVSEQLMALASLGAADAAASVLQLLRSSDALSGTLHDWALLINGLYSPASERVARLHGRVLEDVQSFLVALGTQVLRALPELNTEAGVDATWLALELVALPPVYDTVFAVIRKRVRASFFFSLAAEPPFTHSSHSLVSRLKCVRVCSSSRKTAPHCGR